MSGDGFDLTLSFDNGPTPAMTPAVLDVLAAHDVRATFFVVGQKATQPGALALCARARDAGHWIGNHTWTHSVPLGLRADEPDLAEAEIGRTQHLLAGVARPDPLFRPFGGGGNLDRRLLTRDVVAYLRRERFTCVLWNAVPRDWADPDGWVDTALAQCAAQPWTLMVLHDLPTGAMRHLDRFLHLVRDRGARLRQDFPPDCVPIVAGTPVRPLDEYVALAPGESP